MSAFPSIYIWTGSSVPPTRPSTTSTYTWSSGAYTAPSGWSTTAPSNTVAGNYLWIITVPLNASATTVSSTLDWTSTANPIRAIAYNGANGANGTNGTNGTNGSNGSATFIVTRSANDSSAPSNAEVIAVIGRNPVAGDIVTVSYNLGNNAVVYRYTTNWVTQATYITGSLIVSNTITGDKVAANTITGTNIAATTITAANIASNTITATQIASATISAGNMAANSITAANAAIADAAITSAKIGDLQVSTLKIANNAVTVPVAAFTAASTSFGTGFWNTVQSLTVDCGSTLTPVYFTFGFCVLPIGAYVRVRLTEGGTTLAEWPNLVVGYDYAGGVASFGFLTSAFTGIKTFNMDVMFTVFSQNISHRYMNALGVKK
jgi:hypothetical protein